MISSQCRRHASRVPAGICRDPCLTLLWTRILTYASTLRGDLAAWSSVSPAAQGSESELPPLPAPMSLKVRLERPSWSQGYQRRLMKTPEQMLGWQLAGCGMTVEQTRRRHLQLVPFVRLEQAATWRRWKRRGTWCRATASTPLMCSRHALLQKRLSCSTLPECSGVRHVVSNSKQGRSIYPFKPLPSATRTVNGIFVWPYRLLLQSRT